MKRELTKPMVRLGELDLAREKLNNGKSVHLTGVTECGQVHLTAALGEKYRVKVYVAVSEKRAREMCEEMKLYSRNVYYYPAKDFIFFGADVHGNLIREERIHAISGLINDDEVTVVTTIDALMDRLVPVQNIRSSVLTIDYDTVMGVERLAQALVEMGYERCDQIYACGQFCVRGSIVDVFPLNESDPYRIDFWDDTVDSLKVFDVNTQRTIDKVEKITLYPASEYIMTRETFDEGIKKLRAEAEAAEASLRQQAKNSEAHHLKMMAEEAVENMEIMGTGAAVDSFVSYFYSETSSFADYPGLSECLFFIEEPQQALERCRAVEEEFADSMRGRLEKGYALPGQTEVMMSTRELFEKLAGKRCVLLSALEYSFSEIPAAGPLLVSMKNISPYNRSFELLVKDLTGYTKSKYRVVLVCASHTRGHRMADTLLNDFGVNAFYSDEEGRLPEKSQVMITYGNMRRGVEFPSIKYVIIAETDVFGAERKEKKKKTEYSGKRIADFSQIKPGDYVIHENYGLGIYCGIEKIEVDKTVRDYIKVQYDKGGVLYVPTPQLDLIQKYADSDSAKPKINTLGTKDWSLTKSRVRHAARDVAKELVSLYAARQAKKGFSYSADTVWQQEFEELFEYEETKDQLRAIEETKADMESDKIMDRLICADVGYGKTEIAIRAAFKAVQDGKQVAFLVPTTILAAQHFNTISARMKDFPVTVELMCRLRTAGQQREVIQKLKTGEADIVVGTHRLLSKDICFKDLGLLVVDEEQRFGVAHKEKIKQLRENVDVLTLTATPIPRTLHMGLAGIRDMSVLDEPPMDRLPIQTYVMEYNEEMVREAIKRELARGGQVYYVCNRINSIDSVTAALRQLVPEANIVYAHGQMNEKKMEEIMYDFINGGIDVLVSTTIIETGLDIPNVNTIIIQDADKFGLSQLYQLRGRVGRSTRTSYAFMMYRRGGIIKEVAGKRLSAIREFTELGSGIRIAMKDLEIRGAGNVLGAEQHGHMEAVGYDLYCKLLSEAVSALREGTEPEEEINTEIDIKIDAYIPPSYIRNEMQKLNMYKKIACVSNEDELFDMTDELNDRFGEIPRPVLNLLSVSVIRHQASAAQIVRITADRREMVFEMYEKSEVDTAALAAMVGAYGGRLNFSIKGKPKFIYRPAGGELLDNVEKVVKEIGKIKAKTCN